MALIPKPTYICKVCSGTMTLQRRYENKIKMDFRNEKDNVVVVRITEEWRCHNGHLHMVNFDKPPKLIINN